MLMLLSITNATTSPIFFFLKEDCYQFTRHWSSLSHYLFIFNIYRNKLNNIAYIPGEITMNSDSYETPHRSLLEYEEPTVNESLRVSRVLPSPSSGNDMKVVRDLSRIRRRRSDPATKRWREQYSKIYKEQIPNEFREHPFPVFPAIARKSRIYAQATRREVEAAKTIQRQARRLLSGRMKTSKENNFSVFRHDSHDALIIEKALTM